MVTAAAHQRLTEELWRPDDLQTPGSPRSERHVVLTSGGQLTVVPCHDARAAAASMIRWSDATTPREVATRAAGWAAFRCGLGARFVGEQIDVRTTGTGPEPALHEHLAAVLNVPRVHLSIALGSVRPNRKPIVRVHGSGGTTLAYAKLGWDPLTDRLVSTEAAFLASVDRSQLGSLRIPSVIDDGRWRSHPLLVLTPLPCGLPVRRPRPPEVEQLEAVAASAPVTRSALRDSTYWAGIDTWIDTAIDAWSGEPHAAGLHEQLRRRGHEDVRFGQWHGDWTPWNMCRTRTSLAVWDWERTAADVPVGLDALHYHFQRHLRRSPGVPAGDRLRAAVLDSSDVLHDLGVGSVSTYVGLYALEMLRRFGPASTVAWMPGLVAAAAELLATTDE